MATVRKSLKELKQYITDDISTSTNFIYDNINNDNNEKIKEQLVMHMARQKALLDVLDYIESGKTKQFNI